jgi:arginine-tRNA-protein transferase
MIVLDHELSEPRRCAYLKEQMAVSEELFVEAMSLEEYQELMNSGWRRFGHAVYRPRCPSCDACRALRIPVDRFVPNRAQRRVRSRNEGVVTLEVGEPTVDEERIDLYNRFHAARSRTRQWDGKDETNSWSYAFAFAVNPIPTAEYRYRLHGKLVGVGYVDELPEALSAIYFLHDPDHADRNLGTWNVLSVIERARSLGRPWVHLGYYVSDCLSLAYKASFQPYELLEPGQGWRQPPGLRRPGREHGSPPAQTVRLRAADENSS